MLARKLADCVRPPCFPSTTGNSIIIFSQLPTDQRGELAWGVVQIGELDRLVPDRARHRVATRDRDIARFRSGGPDILLCRQEPHHDRDPVALLELPA